MEGVKTNNSDAKVVASLLGDCNNKVARYPLYHEKFGNPNDAQPSYNVYLQEKKQIKFDMFSKPH